MKVDNKQKVLNLFFEAPQKEFHIRLLARLTKLNPNTIIKITDNLAKEGFITKKKSHLVYRFFYLIASLNASKAS